MMSRAIDFWFSIGSTYTYLSVMRLADVARRTSVSFRWRPFNVRAIMVDMNNIPFATKPIKARYMWRDVERRAAMYDIRWSAIPRYPLKDLAYANRIALVAAREGWCADYVTTVYRRWFEHGQDASMDPNVSDSLRELGQEPGRVVQLAGSDQIGAARSMPRRRSRAGWGFSARQHSQWGRRAFGATTVLMMPSHGSVTMRAEGAMIGQAGPSSRDPSRAHAFRSAHRRR